MSFQLSREQFRTMILYDWKIGLTYKESHNPLVQAWGTKHLQTVQFSIGFMNFNEAISLLKMLPVQIVLELL
jgi:hypothetical protein